MSRFVDGDVIARIERLTVSDLPDVLRLVEQTDEAPRWSEGAWQAFVAEPEPEAALRRVLWGARDEAGRVCGVLAGNLLGPVAELELVLVAAERRGRGTGTALVESWLRWAADQGAEQAELEVRRANLGAQRLYEGLGFASHGVRAGYYRDPVDDAVLMRRELAMVPKPRAARARA